MDACIFKMDANLTTMVWSSTFGGSEDDAAYSVSVDGDENLFVAGGTISNNFPVTNGIFQNTFGGGTCDGFITHIDKNGQTRIASTYFGFGDYDQIYFVDLDKANNVYVFGQADNSAANYIRNATYNKPNGGQFISKFNEALDTLIWSTSWGRGLGTTDISPTAFLVDVCNNVYACGWGSQGVNNIVGGTGGTTGLDTTAGAYKTFTDGQDFYLMVMRDDASALTYATFMGGAISEEHVDGGTSRFDRKGQVYQSVCAGCGNNDDFPTTPGAVSRLNRSNNCNNAVFKFDLDLPVCLSDFSYPNACKNFPVQFTNQSTSVLSPTYQWYFGDGNSSTQINPSHSFSQTGLFDVVLIISDPGSCNLTDTIVKKILVIGGVGSDTLPTLSVCSGKTTQIGFPPINDTSVVYQWTPANTLSAANVSNPIATPIVTTTYLLLVNNGICVDTFYQTVAIVTEQLNLTASNVICAGDTILLSATSGSGNSFIRYTWTPTGLIIAGTATANPLAVPLTDTTFYVTVETFQNCLFSDSIRVVIPAATIVEADFIPPPSGCIPYTAQFTSTGNVGVGASYEWRFGDGGTSNSQSPIHTYAQGGFFNITLIVRNNNSCNKIDSITRRIVLLSDSLFSLPAITICLNDSTAIGFVVNDPSLTYQWQPGSTLSNSSISNPIAFPQDSTTYLLLISNGLCSDSIFQAVNVYKDSIYATGDTLVCSFDHVQLFGNHINAQLPLIYDWRPNQNIVSGDSTNNPTVFAVTTTAFVVTAENSLHCRYSDSAVVSIFSSQANVIATADPDTITWGGSSQLNADSSNAIWLMWKEDSTLSATDVTNPIATPLEDHVYIVSVYDENGCRKTDSIWVYVLHTPCAETNLYIPNAFSPNGDGKNDMLFVRGNGITRLYFAVYDRWGQKVFESKDIMKGWDGIFKGKKIDPAVFGYYLEGDCEGGEKFFKKGNVTLLR